MTNGEFIASNHLSSDISLKFWEANKHKYPNPFDWLEAERMPKFKIGDIICGNTGTYYVNIITSISNTRYHTRCFANGNWMRSYIAFIEEHCLDKIGHCGDSVLLKWKD